MSTNYPEDLQKIIESVNKAGDKCREKGFPNVHITTNTKGKHEVLYSTSELEKLNIGDNLYDIAGQIYKIKNRSKIVDETIASEDHNAIQELLQELQIENGKLQLEIKKLIDKDNDIWEQRSGDPAKKEILCKTLGNYGKFDSSDIMIIQHNTLSIKLAHTFNRSKKIIMLFPVMGKTDGLVTEDYLIIVKKWGRTPFPSIIEESSYGSYATIDFSDLIKWANNYNIKGWSINLVANLIQNALSNCAYNNIQLLNQSCETYYRINDSGNALRIIGVFRWDKQSWLKK